MSEHAPGPRQIERCVAAMQRARAGFESDGELASDEAVLVAALASDPNILSPDELLRRMIAAIAFAEAREAEAKAFADSMKAREKRYGTRAANLRNELMEIMVALERRSFAGSPFGTASLKAGQRSVLLLDEGQIPDEYFRTQRVLDKRALAADLRDGVIVDGAVLSNAAPVLSIRRDKLKPDQSSDE